MADLTHQLLISPYYEGQGVVLGGAKGLMSKAPRKPRGPTLLSQANQALKGQKFPSREARQQAVRMEIEKLKQMKGGYSFSEFLDHAKTIGKVALDLGKRGLEYYEKNPETVKKYAKAALDLVKSRPKRERERRTEEPMEASGVFLGGAKRAVVAKRRELMAKYNKKQLAEMLAELLVSKTEDM